MSLVLIRELVVLLAAIIAVVAGFYKAMKYRKDSLDQKEKNENEPSLTAWFINTFGDILQMAGFMFLLPLAIFGFIWSLSLIMNSISKINDWGDSGGSAISIQYSVPYEFSDPLSDLELSLIAASHITSEHYRSANLANLVGKGLEKCEIEFSIAAAVAIPSEHPRRLALEDVIQRIDECSVNIREQRPPISGAP